MINFHSDDQKTVDHNTVQWPEEGLVDFRSIRRDGKTEVSMTNYRYKNTVDPENPKSVLIFLHGFGSWTGKYAYYVKVLADRGYDVVGYDLKGFGKT